jgi:hypothetical protein
MTEYDFKKIAEDVEEEWKMGGLSEGLYYDYAKEVAMRYIRGIVLGLHKKDKSCKECNGIGGCHE